VFFTDEAAFTRDDTVNFHNLHTWTEISPHNILESSHQQRFSLNVWAGVLGNQLIGPYFIQHRLTGASYLEFLQKELLPHLLEDVPLAASFSMWFMHDGVPLHFSLVLRAFLNDRYPRQWIGRGGPTEWPARSPDLNPLDFYMWGHLKSVGYTTPVSDVMELQLHARTCAEEMECLSVCEDL
jgi:hypothetical protein